jgi:hypothetical protein
MRAINSNTSNMEDFNSVASRYCIYKSILTQAIKSYKRVQTINEVKILCSCYKGALYGIYVRISLQSFDTRYLVLYCISQCHKNIRITFLDHCEP